MAKDNIYIENCYLRPQTIKTTYSEYGGVRQVYRAGIGEILPNIKRAQVVYLLEPFT